MLWVGKVMVNSGRFGRHRYPGWWALLWSIPAGLGVGFKECPPYKSYKSDRVAAPKEHRTTKCTLVGGHCSGKFRQSWGLVSSNTHPTKCVLVGGHCSDQFCQGWGLVSSNAHPTKCVLQNAFALEKSPEPERGARKYGEGKTVLEFSVMTEGVKLGKFLALNRAAPVHTQAFAHQESIGGKCGRCAKLGQFGKFGNSTNF
ncbi:hypothetical protein [Moorena sp. SIO4G3]|uniref:hypothetical protein n=1 Tax=Moorena sp. SIO4G3 TaxID=2607821 RepID=UPI00142C5F9E|nr:hypothetical protein [Moorena sp. SIO4G3]NEO75562.1 hypothetical protein [Moorena sp. SIO4G3]